VLCDRIQARAIRRSGELLREIPAGKNRFDRRDGADPPNRVTAKNYPAPSTKY
jgi:hypothetical protein